MFRMRLLAEDAVLSGADDKDRLAGWGPATSSSSPSIFAKGRRTGLHARLSSGVVGAVELSKVMTSSASIFRATGFAMTTGL